ncbi:(4Fe-4S)-binding protein [Deferribacter autotrophicus]|uniref:(4Fe-4S)-binding protein n=1 Tax=Deferribacter autotrophicus TaxID=500465 RepID=A0A5A8EZE1_9BACT|nr:ATP-binding protein [Deferribacter autotrophicus]KAA0257050.1 (4Fe-4S)-binding protein [Deferribacter autotrophicus]
MKEIVVVSGKGGAGKSTVTASLAYFLNHNDVLVDADVDAADLHILMKPDIETEKDFYSGLEFVIDNDVCTNCDECRQKCEYDAINVIDGRYLIDGIACEGCGFCSYVCSVEAISSSEKLTGKKYISNTRFGFKMVHAKLNVAEENSGKLVAEVKKDARELAEKQNSEIILVDGPPGVGCSTISALSNADIALLVVESTVSGLHDIKRCMELLQHFKSKICVIINKFGLNPDIDCEILNYFEDKEVEMLGKVDYSLNVVDSLKRCMVLPEYAELYKKVFAEIFDGLKKM